MSFTYRGVHFVIHLWSHVEYYCQIRETGRCCCWRQAVRSRIWLMFPHSSQLLNNPTWTGTMRVCRIAGSVVESRVLSWLARDWVGAACKMKCCAAGGQALPQHVGRNQGVLHCDTFSCFHISSSFSVVSSSFTSVSSSHPPPPGVLLPYIFPCSSSCLSFSCSLPHCISLVCLSSPLQPHFPATSANFPHILFSFPYFYLSSSFPYFTCL